ncbi:hypothetical protein [Terrisporobacter sp.]|uniref:hypothetical protein n=1 Tax=Terrisporobacter sp. TaxID=1965305 RepID=UPI00289B534A|nr:hypothetical protein [Terrisporobacter sp.]
MINILKQFGEVKSVPSTMGESWEVENIEIFLNHKSGSLKARNMIKGSSRLLIENFSYSFEDEDTLINFIKENLQNKITFNVDDLKQGILNPHCSCGSHNIEKYYDGETTEDYTFTCECGSKAIINGYVLDNLID